MKTCVQGSGYLNLCLGQSFIHFALLSGIFWFLQLVYHLQEKIGVQIDYSARLHTALCAFKCVSICQSCTPLSMVGWFHNLVLQSPVFLNTIPNLN